MSGEVPPTATEVDPTGASWPHAERIDWQGQLLTIIVRGTHEPTRTEFITPQTLNQQVGFVVHPAGDRIQPHSHRRLEREIYGTPEVLIVRRGRCEIEIFAEDRTLVCTRELRAGDVMLMIAGGHGFRMLEDTVFLEIKPGPYLGDHEKELYP